ncbi:MAG: Glu-tRNA(Gln) amidotransferase subunit GatE [Thermoplasmata archaeon]
MFKAGLEIHQQLDTKKLFCSCDSYLSENVIGEFTRVLRPVQSELGEYDAAAMMESMKRMTFVYQVTENSCLVEMDEEPPHDVNMEALETSILISLMFHCKIVDEVHFMRKIVIDGSNTTGFQRTALIGMDGYIETNKGKISIRSVCLEEESARKIENRGNIAIYRLDRLGIPLVEITTGPDMKSPEEVKEVAERIGYLLRSTKKVKRGIGAIRQDLNISTDGERVEVKGVSRLNLIEKIARYEMERQSMLTAIANELKFRNPDLQNIQIVDVTNVFLNSKSKIINNAISKGHKVLGIRVAGFKGILKSEKFRFGKELAEIARAMGIPGIFHSDELPNYGITKDEVKMLEKYFGISGNDAFIIIAAEESKGKEVIEMIVNRIRRAKDGVISETRGPRDDGTTEFMRPLPGKERMYPETDVPPIYINEELIEKLKSRIPKPYEEAIKELSINYGISEQQARQIIDEEREDEFFEYFSIYNNGNVIFRTLFNILPELGNDGLDVSKVSSNDLEKIFMAIANKKILKEAIPYLIRDKIEKGTMVIDDYSPFDESTLKKIIENIINENIEKIKSKNPISAIMGITMERLKGRADGEIVNKLIREIIGGRGEKD